MYFFLCAWPLATLAFSCTDEEFKAIQNAENVGNFLIHSFEDVLNGSMSRVALLKLLSISENDRQLPVIFDTRSLRTANTDLLTEHHPQMCLVSEGDEEHFKRQIFLSPQGSKTAGILYGCDIKTFENSMFFFYDEHRWDSEKPRYHRRFQSMSPSFKSEICNCNRTVETFTKNCVIAKVARETFKRNLLLLGILSFFICAFLIGYVVKNFWKKM